MPRVCKACTDPDRQYIDKWIVDGRKLRDISEKFGLSISVIHRHREHVRDRLQKAEERLGDSVLDEVKKLFPPVLKLFAACDEYLRDPDNDSKYNLGPRDSDIEVIYLDQVPNPETGTMEIAKGARPRKAMLSQLLDRTDKHVLSVRYKIADPRELVLKTAATADGLLSHLGRLTGQERPGGDTVNIQVNLYDVMPRIMAVLDRFPEARQAVIDDVAGRINGSRQLPGS